MIEIVNLTKRFGELVAVDNLNINIKEGELFAFLGPNAAGKTTTIKMLVGLMKPTAGEVYLNNFDIKKDYLAAKQIISYIPDVPFLYEKLTAREFLEFIVDLYDLDRSEKVKEIVELLGSFNLSGVQHELIENYSHGMRQKLIFAAAFLHEPMVLIIDEPMVGLDPHSAKVLKEILKQKTRTGVTVFLSTHTLSVAEELADRIGIIDHGRLVACGTLDELSRDTGIHGTLEQIFLQLTDGKNADDRI
ncbi:MAG: ABC transporter ATP-binding protein [Candidatus Omnitrophota bacterium]